MTGGTVNGYIFINGTAFISGGTVNGYLNLWTGTLSVSGGPALGETCYIAYDGTYLPTVDLRGMNDCTAMKLMVYSCPDGLYNYITLPAGYALYSGDTIVGESDFVNDDSTLTIGQCPHSSFDANGKCTICGYRYAASVTTSGGEVTKYATLAEAISAASSGDKITLLDDVTIGQNETAAFDAWVEIEANGHTITNNGTIVLPSTYTWATIPSGITGGTVTIGSKSYTWNGTKYVCADENSHIWADATCTTPKTCFVCGKTDGNVGEHTLGEDGICTVC